VSTFSITADQQIVDDLSSSDGAFAITVVTKSLLLCLVSEDVVLLLELESFLVSIGIILLKDTETSRFLLFDNVMSYISLIYAPLTLFTALLCYQVYIE
jgi:hypothetical protein